MGMLKYESRNPPLDKEPTSWTSYERLILVIWRLSNQMIAFWKFSEVYLMLQWIYSSKIEDLH